MINLFRNCRMALRFLCDLAPAGTPRTQCIKNIDAYQICPKFFCFCKEGWFLDRTTGIENNSKIKNKSYQISNY